jgi:hypothetical protein
MVDWFLTPTDKSKHSGVVWAVFFYILYKAKKLISILQHAMKGIRYSSTFYLTSVLDGSG